MVALFTYTDLVTIENRFKWIGLSFQVNILAWMWEGSVALELLEGDEDGMVVVGLGKSRDQISLFLWLLYYFFNRSEMGLKNCISNRKHTMMLKYVTKESIRATATESAKSRNTDAIVARVVAS